MPDEINESRGPGSGSKLLNLLAKRGEAGKVAPDRSEIHFLTGLVVTNPETDGTLRLFPNPLDGRQYYIIRADDVTSYKEWDSGHIRRDGPVGGLPVGGTIFRLSLKHGAEIRRVRVTESIHRVGQSTLPAGGLRPQGCGCGGGSRVAGEVPDPKFQYHKDGDTCYRSTGDDTYPDGDWQECPMSECDSQ